MIKLRKGKESFMFRVHDSFLDDMFSYLEPEPAEDDYEDDDEFTIPKRDFDKIKKFIEEEELQYAK